MTYKPLVLAIVLTLSGCGQKEPLPTVDSMINKPVVASVAQQTLGEGAISINPFAFQRINVPGIYAVRANDATGRHSYIEICPRDMRIRSIAEMEVDERASTRTFSDLLDNRNVSVSTPFVAAKTKYTMQSVNGYKAVSAQSGGSTDAADWILENVGPKCREVLKDNIPYFIAVGKATSESIDVVNGGGVNVVPFNVGIVNVEVELSDAGSRVVNTERVFAISGKLFRADGTITNHGSY